MTLIVKIHHRPVRITLITLLLAAQAFAANPASTVLFSDQPVKRWDRQGYPIGNGRLGAVTLGGVKEEVVQFNENSLWSGANNWDGKYDLGDLGFGTYKNFGRFRVAFSGGTKIDSPSGHAKGNGQPIDNSSDEKPATKWCIEKPGEQVQWQISLPEPTVVRNYALTSADDMPPRDPQNWVLEGSNDGREWSVVDRQKLASPLKNRHERVQFIITSPKAWKHYRFTFATPDYSFFQVAEISLDGIPAVATDAVNYRRALDVTTGLVSTSFTRHGITYSRECFASHPDQAVVFHYQASKPHSLNGRISLESAHKAPTTADANGLSFAGTLPNNLRHAAGLRVLPVGGSVRVEGETLVFEKCDSLVLLLNARTDYKPDFAAGWRSQDNPLQVLQKELDAASAESVTALKLAHVKDLKSLLDRASVDIGTTDPATAALTTAARKKLYADGGTDPDLEELVFHFGRYILASCSRAGGLPANLQGLWNDSNNPMWASDYHNNINVQMNYWLAETTNLSECHRPLVDFILAQAEPCRIATRKAFGDTIRGWTARTSQNIFGGNGWEWNIPASAWYAIHVFDHWSFTRDNAFLESTALPVLKEICELWEDRLKALPDGTLVVPSGWSPEHGPREDGVMHDQQIIWELFQDYIEASDALGKPDPYRATVADMQSRLAPNKIGKWGQLQEWQTDRDDPDNQHRHTSHLFGVYPGRQIGRTKTPDLAKAATLSLLARSGAYGKNAGKPFTVDSTEGDSRQSWTWTWRCALWARLGQGDNAALMLRGHLTHSTFENLYAFCLGDVFQIDGVLGMPGAITEMLMQSHEGHIEILPAVPSAWAKQGSFRGLRARGGFVVDCEWKDGKVTALTVHSNTSKTAKVSMNGVSHDVKTVPLTQ